MRRGILEGEEIAARPTYVSPMWVLGPLVENARRLPPIVVDGAIGVTIFVAGYIEPGFAPSQHPGDALLLAIASLSVTLRRTVLWAACTLMVIAGILRLAAGGPFPESFANELAELVLLYTVAELCGPAVSLAALIAENVFGFLQAGAHWNVTDIWEWVWVFAPWNVLAWFAGRVQARRRAIASDLRQSDLELREERDRLARGAVMSERARIARDLHGLVVRSVERMNATTRTARRELHELGEAPRSIGRIEAIGRGALVEMRRLLIVLRARDDGERDRERTFHEGSNQQIAPPMASVSHVGGRSTALLGRS